MEDTQLEYFLVLAEELHFRRAAQRLGVSQPALSMRIRALEEELGAVLLHRTSRVVTLTAAGRLFRQECRGILGRMAVSRQRLADLASGRGSRLIIAYIESVLQSFLPQSVRRYQQNFPHCPVQLLMMDTLAQLEALRTGAVDLALCRPFGLDLSPFASRLLRRESYLLALPAGHRLCARASVPLRELDGENLILFPERINPKLHRLLLGVIEASGAVPERNQEVSSKGSALALASAGIGVALLPASVCTRTDCPELEFRPLAGDLPPVEYYALWNHEPDNPEAIRNFLALIADDDPPA